MLFNLHIFVKFPNFLLLLISAIHSLWKLILWSSMIAGECSTCVWEVYSISIMWCVQSMSFRPSWFIVLSRSPTFFFLIEHLSSCSIHYWKKSIEVSKDYCWIVYFFLQLSQLLLHVFWVPVIRCMYIHNCYIFLMSWDFFFVIKCPLSLVTWILFLTREMKWSSWDSSSPGLLCLEWSFSPRGEGRMREGRLVLSAASTQRGLLQPESGRGMGKAGSLPLPRWSSSSRLGADGRGSCLPFGHTDLG